MVTPSCSLRGNQHACRKYVFICFYSFNFFCVIGKVRWHWTESWLGRPSGEAALGAHFIAASTSRTGSATTQPPCALHLSTRGLLYILGIVRGLFAADLIRWCLSNLHSLHVLTQPENTYWYYCLLYTSPSPRDLSTSRMPSSA